MAQIERQTKPHWLRGPGKPRSPRVVVSFDTETTSRQVDGAEVLTLRCWDATVRVRGRQTGREDTTIDYAGTTAGQLADVLTAAVTVTGEAWCFAHNIGFDLTVTSLPMVLTERGWQTEFVNIGDESCVFVFRGDAGRLVLTDSWSWLRCSLQVAARDVGMRKTRLPDERDSLADWHHRCHHDVLILDRLLADLLDWWDSQELGAFAVTAAACGWRSLRAKIKPRSVLVGPEAERTQFERRALFGGRKEVWRVGEITGRWVEDWDLVAAHQTVVANLPLPARPMAIGRLTASLNALAPPDGVGTVCEVQVTTRTPCAPVRVAGEVWWPVGRFRTVVTSAELPAILQVADRVRLIRARWYWLTDDLQDWGRWCEQVQTGAAPGTPKVVRRVAKGWGRSVPGRFALRRSVLIAERQATHLGWALETGHDLSTGDTLEVITYGGVERTYRKDQDGADVSPVVLAFVEGYVRAGLAAVLAGRPPALLLQCNTDGWWEIRGQRHATAPGQVVPAPWQVARKAVSRQVTVQGPNHLQAPGDRRLAGVPKDAHQRLDGTYTWQDWPGLRWQLQFSRPGEYIRPRRELMLQDHYCRRWVLTTGETVPVTVLCDRAGRPALQPWSRTAGRLPGDELAAHQVPALQGLADRAERVVLRRLAPGPHPLGRP